MNTNSNEVLQYTISIIGNGKIDSFCLNDFGKNTITFGRSGDNDIVLSSPIVSSHHGHFCIDRDLLTIFDDNSKNGTLINGISGYNGYSLSDGDYIKIDNPVEPLNQGILMIVTIGKDNNRWVEFDLSSKDVITIGRSKECDISLDRVSIPLKHAKITNKKNSYAISCFDSKVGIILNNAILLNETDLKEKDVILINDIRLIYSQNKLLYQYRESGVRLDAIDIVKTVKVKGKKKDISQHVNFSAAPGEFIAFVGGSGAGKSTFMKCISGVTKPTSGQVLINGNDLYSNYEVLKKLIGYVPQDNIIFDDLTLGDMLKYAANLRMPDDANKMEKDTRIKEVLEVVELLDKQDVMIRNLSGGQQKRACIAVELIADPKLFFLDEPTSGLDPGTERSLMKTLRKMANSGKTIILVTHNTLNLHLCDKVVFFGYGGKLCFDGKPADALNFFGVNDFVDIYTIINNDVDKWRDTFAKSGYKIEHDETETKKEQNVTKGTKSKSFIKQFVTLVKRKFKTLLNNKQQLLMLFGQAPLVAILLTMVVTDNLFYSYEETKSILFSLSTAAIWVGLLNSIQEVCREKVILEKEVMSDLRISAYLASKVVYFLVLSFVQSFLLVGAFTAMTDVPKMGLMYNWFIESVFIVFLTIFSASSMGLVASCIAKDSSVALTMPTIILVPQLIFSGILFPLDGVTEKLSNLILSKWSVESLGTINDLNSLVTSIQEVLPGYVREAEDCFTFTREHLGYELSVIVVMTVILIMISYFILKRRLESDK